jgi:hypothetical protein
MTTMADIHIERTHHFSMTKARKIAFEWAEQVETEFGMACTYEEGEHEDLVTFVRSGVKGTLRVCAKRFELNAKLGTDRKFNRMRPSMARVLGLETRSTQAV